MKKVVNGHSIIVKNSKILNILVEFANKVCQGFYYKNLIYSFHFCFWILLWESSGRKRWFGIDVKIPKISSAWPEMQTCVIFVKKEKKKNFCHSTASRLWGWALQPNNWTNKLKLVLRLFFQIFVNVFRTMLSKWQRFNYCFSLGDKNSFIYYWINLRRMSRKKGLSLQEDF